MHKKGWARIGDRLVWSDTRRGEVRCSGGKGALKSCVSRKGTKSWSSCWRKTARRARDRILGISDRGASCCNLRFCTRLPGTLMGSCKHEPYPQASVCCSSSNCCHYPVVAGSMRDDGRLGLVVLVRHRRCGRWREEWVCCRSMRSGTWWIGGEAIGSRHDSCFLKYLRH